MIIKMPDPSEVAAMGDKLQVISSGLQQVKSSLADLVLTMKEDGPGVDALQDALEALDDAIDSIDDAVDEMNG